MYLFLDCKLIQHFIKNKYGDVKNGCETLFISDPLWRLNNFCLDPLYLFSDFLPDFFSYNYDAILHD